MSACLSQFFWLILGIVLAGLLPHLIKEEGIQALFFVAASWGFFSLWERVARTRQNQGRSGTLILFTLLIAFHSFLDGLGVSLEARGPGFDNLAHEYSFLSLSIVLHRLPACIALVPYSTRPQAKATTTSFGDDDSCNTGGLRFRPVVCGPVSDRPGLSLC